MSYIKTVATSLCALAFTGAAFAEDSNLADRDQINGCLAEAVDAITIPGATRYNDESDSGIKKYYETDTVFTGVSAFLNYYPREDEATSDNVIFMAKYFTETAEGYMDVSAQTEVSFDANGPLVDPNDFMAHDGYSSYIADMNHDSFSDAPPPAEHILVSNAVDTMAATFASCMAFPAFQPANGAPVQSPDFQAFLP